MLVPIKAHNSLILDLRGKYVTSLDTSYPNSILFKDIRNAFLEADDSSEEIDSIVYIVKANGGDLFEIFNTMGVISNCRKQTIAIIWGYAFGGSYFLASQADKVYALNSFSLFSALRQYNNANYEDGGGDNLQNIFSYENIWENQDGVLNSQAQLLFERVATRRGFKVDSFLELLNWGGDVLGAETATRQRLLDGVLDEEESLNYIKQLDNIAIQMTPKEGRVNND